ncbi:MAG: hypothetical protein P4L83_19035 [Nevskia sp.]|nr:hypothetical protein [Nevskia sp.]
MNTRLCAWAVAWACALAPALAPAGGPARVLTARFEVTLTIASSCQAVTDPTAGARQGVTVSCQPATPYGILWGRNAAPDRRYASPEAVDDAHAIADGDVVTVIY